MFPMLEYMYRKKKKFALAIDSNCFSPSEICSRSLLDTFC